MVVVKLWKVRCRFLIISRESLGIRELARGFQLAIGKRFEPYIGVV